MEAQEIISSGLLELYVAGICSAEESLQVQQWVKQYPEVAAELSSIEESIEKYAKAEMTLAPDASVKEKIFARINQGKPVAAVPVVPINENNHISNQSTSFSMWRTAAAAAVLLLLGSAVLNVVLFNKKSTAEANLQQTQHLLSKAEEKTTALEQDMQVVQSKYSQSVSLAGMEAAPEAAAKIFWMKNTGEVFIDASNLPATPAGKKYQLWAFVDGKPKDAGYIVTTKSGSQYQIQKMKTFGKVEAFAVTLEVPGDVPAQEPHGPIFVMGKL